MNKEELVKAVADKAKLSQKQTAEVVAALLETVQKTVSKGKKVTLVGFGTFEARKRAARTGRNPQTGKEIKIAAKTVTTVEFSRLKILHFYKNNLRFDKHYSLYLQDY